MVTATNFTYAELMAKQRVDRVSSLRNLVEFLEAHESVPAPYLGDFYLFARSKEEFLALRRLGGFEIKNADDQHFRMERSFGEFRLVLCVDREHVCERVKVGTRVVPAQPAKEAQPERVEEVFEWRCPESVLNGHSEA